MTKDYYTFQTIKEDVLHLSNLIKHSGIKYDAILALSGGGLIPARLLRTYIDIPIYTVGISFYVNDKKQDAPIVFQWLRDVELKMIINEKLNILIVDDLDDTRDTLLHVVRNLNEDGIPSSQLDIAVLYNKEKSKVGNLNSEINYYMAKSVPDNWIVFPWDWDYNICANSSESSESILK